MRRICLVLALALLVLPGCFPSQQFVRAVDRHTSVIVPEYRAYVEADPALDVTSRRIRLESADALAALIEEAKGGEGP